VPGNPPGTQYLSPLLISSWARVPRSQNGGLDEIHAHGALALLGRNGFNSRYRKPRWQPYGNMSSPFKQLTADQGFRVSCLSWDRFSSPCETRAKLLRVQEPSDCQAKPKQSAGLLTLLGTRSTSPCLLGNMRLPRLRWQRQ